MKSAISLRGRPFDWLLSLTFTDGTSLTQDLSLTFVPWLSRLIISFKQTTPSLLEMNALASWEYSEAQSGNIADEVRNTVFAECKPLEVVPMTLAPIPIRTDQLQRHWDI